MKRSQVLAAAAGVVGLAGLGMGAAANTAPLLGKPLKKPANGNIQVAVMINDGATVIDFAGPWETFQDDGFDTHVVSKSLDVVTATNGLKIVPEYTFDTAPQPNVVVVGAQRAPAEALAWPRKVAPGADVVMSVCTGAFIVARSGLLDGQYATTHHDYYDAFAKEFPNIHLVRGPRFVENAQVSCAGGLTSGIDLALRVIERYDGKQAADQVAFYMEHVRTARPS